VTAPYRFPTTRPLGEPADSEALALVAHSAASARGLAALLPHRQDTGAAALDSLATTDRFTIKFRYRHLLAGHEAEAAERFEALVGAASPTLTS
jgi:hypothetical protein